jgi:hypothetical protein
MEGNKADLPELDKRLKQLTDIDTVGCSDNLKQRLDKLKVCVVWSRFQPAINAFLFIS